MIYFIHDITNRTIKVGHATDVRKRLSQLQISTSNKLVLLGTIAGTKRTEKKVHDLICEHCVPRPGEPYTRPLCVKGEWFDDRILPFVEELMKSPKQFLDLDKKPSTRPVVRDASLHEGKIVLVFDSGETFQERFILRAASPDHALGALQGIARGRLPFLANTVRITQISVPGRPTRSLDLRGAFATQRCMPRDGLSVVFNSEAGGSFSTIDGIKQYSNRWLHGVPDELCDLTKPYGNDPTSHFRALLHGFAQVLIQSQCVITASNPLPVRGLMPGGLCRLPKGELRSNANKRAAAIQKRLRPRQVLPPRDGVVYFIQDVVKLDIKIGFCLKKPEKRLAALQTGNSNALRLLGHVLGSEAHESLLHARFKQHRLQGEWFADVIQEEIERIARHASIEEWLKTQGTVVAVQVLEATLDHP